MRAKSKFTKQLSVTVQPSASLLRNLPIPNRLWRGADSFGKIYASSRTLPKQSAIAVNAKGWAELLQLSTAFSGNSLKHFTLNGIITIQRESTHSKVDAPS